MTPRRLGIVLMLGQQIFFLIDTAAIHHVGSHVSQWQLGLAWSSGGLCLALTLACTIGGPVFHVRRPVLQIVRAAASVGYMWTMTASYARLPFVDATAIAYTVAIYVVIFSPFVLGEIVGAQRWIAVAIGFVGAMLIVQPTFSQASLFYLIILLGTGTNGLAVVLNRRLVADGDHPVTVLLYVNVALFINASPGMLDPLPSANIWPWLGVIFLTGPLGMYCGIVALQYADAATLAPYAYVRLVLAMACGAVLFGEVPDIGSVAGAVAIVAACVMADPSFLARGLRLGRTTGKSGIGGRRGR